MKRGLIVYLFLISLYSNAQLDLPEMHFDSVSIVKIDNKYHCIISWEPYDTAPITGYEIWKRYVNDEFEGWHPKIIYKNPDASSFIDTLTEADKHIHTYFMFAYDSSGPYLQTPIEPDFQIEPLHQNILVSVSEYDTCNQIIKLKWNNYYNTEDMQKSVLKYEVIAIASDETISKIVYSEEDSVFYDLHDISPFKTYEIKVRYHGDDFTSTSAPITHYTYIGPEPEFINFDLIATSSSFNNTIKLNFDESKPNGGFFILGAYSLNGEYDTIKNFSANDTTRNFLHEYGNDEPIYYTLGLLNSCNETSAMSDTLNTIILTGEDMISYLALDANDIEGQPNSQYKLNRLANNTASSFDLSPPLSYNDYDIVDQIEQPQITYYIEGITPDSAIVKSNPVQFLIKDNLLWPNAIIVGPGPDGKFKAIPQRTKPETFQMKVFNKWGILVFESSHIDDYWNGYYKGSKAQPGAYLYVAKFKFTGSKEEEIKGTVTVIH